MTVLRAKQLGTLSQSARNFFLSGSRCSAGDGSSCTCSEDETCVSRRPQRQKGVPHPQISSTIASRPSVGVGSLISRDAAVQSHKPDSVNQPIPLPLAIPASASLGRAECVNYASLDAHSMMHSSAPIGDQFVKTGIAAVSLLSDLVNYKIPITDGSGLLGSAQSSVIEHSKTIPTARASNVKIFRKEKVKGKSYPDTNMGSSVANNSSAAKGGIEKSSLVKGNSGVTRGTCSDSFERKRSIPQRSRNYSNHPTANAGKAEGKLGGDVTETEYIPPPEFEEVEKDPLIELNLTDSTELWIVQWPVNQAPDFDGKEVSVKLNGEGNLGSFEGSSGKSYEVVSFNAQDADASVFLPSASNSKIVGKISRRVSLVHYPEPSEYKKDDSLNLKQMARRAATSVTNSANRLTTRQGKAKSSWAVSGYTSSMHTSRDKSSMSGGGERSKPSKKRQVDDPTRSLDQSFQDAGRGHSGLTSTGSEDSRQTKSKKQKKSKD